jgi:tryptophan synthase beta chain
VIDIKITLPESEIPTHFYNIQPDLPTPLPPPLHPATREPIGPELLAPIFPMGLIGGSDARTMVGTR